MKLLVTGARGQVGSALVALAEEEHVETVALDQSRLDISSEVASRRACLEHAPDIVVNTAAYTAVDQAEDEPNLAFMVNRDGARNLALACSEARIPLIHLSTDYVFDGTKAGSYSEGDVPNPAGVYGMSKQEGEEAILAILEQHIILRTSWVFGKKGSNFVRTILGLASDREELRVVSDQYGCPTPATDIARAVLSIARHLGEGEDRFGTYHFAGQPSTTWFRFAEAIVDEGMRHGLNRTVKMIPVGTEAYPTKAKRPANSVLATHKIETAFGISTPDWRAALPKVVSAIMAG